MTFFFEVEETCDMHDGDKVGQSATGAFNNAESFCERVISVCNTAMTDGNTLLSDEELEWLVVLRINSSFMEFMRENYLSEIILTQPFNMTVVDLTQTQDCSESEEEGE